MFPDPQYKGDFPVKGFKILLVEDDEVCRSVLEKVLILCGMDVVSVRSGEEAVGFICENCDIDLVLMDIQLPGIDGVESAKRIKAKTSIPVIAVTALASEPGFKDFPEGLFYDCLPKPVDINALFKIIHKSIGCCSKI